MRFSWGDSGDPSTRVNRGAISLFRWWLVHGLVGSGSFISGTLGSIWCPPPFMYIYKWCFEDNQLKTNLPKTPSQNRP